MGQRSIIITVIISVLVIFLIILLIAARIAGNRNTQTEKPPEEVVKTVSASNIVSDQLVYDGYNVIVESKITDWITENSFTVQAGGTNGIFGGAPRQLLIITENAFPLPQDAQPEDLKLGDEVDIRIEGRVEIVNRERLQELLGINLDDEELKLDDNTIPNWELGPIILPTSVVKL